METKVYTIKEPEYWLPKIRSKVTNGDVKYFERKDLEYTTSNVVGVLDDEIRVLRSRIENNESLVRIAKKSIQQLQVIVDTIKNHR